MMWGKWRALGMVMALPLAACGSGDSARYLIDAPAASAAQTRVSVRTVELRDVSLPSHASGSEILVRNETGALTALGDAVWADDPERAVTGTLAQLLDERSSATVSAEPWPLLDGPSARLDVRIDKMLADVSGVFEITGQAAVSAVDGRPRERVERFKVTAPLTEVTAAAVTEAQGRALGLLADELIGLLR
ncbi:PqiC family protein [Marivita sp. S6314]|uniref:PqiC family protein n=1 Tax=Marivita sp. S6314 TaxID=2926406 RepID=UPI001FF52B74|nr:PqiC family protein [Marivita sp. S6314]MCK0149228.1 PqiC family protein [Marivita sp. S6314]